MKRSGLQVLQEGCFERSNLVGLSDVGDSAEPSKFTASFTRNLKGRHLR